MHPNFDPFLRSISAGVLSRATKTKKQDNITRVRTSIDCGDNASVVRFVCIVHCSFAILIFYGMVFVYIEKNRVILSRIDTYDYKYIYNKDNGQLVYVESKRIGT